MAREQTVTVFCKVSSFALRWCVEQVKLWCVEQVNKAGGQGPGWCCRRLSSVPRAICEGKGRSWLCHLSPVHTAISTAGVDAVGGLALDAALAVDAIGCTRDQSIHSLS